jgi:hypothetical protein
MKELSNVVEILDGDDKPLLMGSFVVRIPARAARCSLQMEAMNVGKEAKENSAKYISFSEKLLNDHLVSIDVIHVPSGTKIASREDLEYIESETLISQICGAVIGGQRLGKQKA